MNRVTQYIWLFLTPLNIHHWTRSNRSLRKSIHPSLIYTALFVPTKSAILVRHIHFETFSRNMTYSYELTETNSSNQNGIAEKINQDLKRITQYLLHTTGLNYGYWSYTINHAAFLKSGRYHSTIKMSLTRPYNIPNLNS